MPRGGGYQTKQKAQVLQYLETHSRQHITAAELLIALNTGGVQIGSATVYRQLEKLEADYVRVPDEKKVPARTYFLVRESDKRIVGMINIRLTLNEDLSKHGGHIGYSIRPTERGKGYNKINLYLGLKVLDTFGVKTAFLDAGLDNPASWKTMEALGGVRVREYFDDEEAHCTVVDYNIDVKKALEEHKEFEKQTAESKFI